MSVLPEVRTSRLRARTLLLGLVLANLLAWLLAASFHASARGNALDAGWRQTSTLAALAVSRIEREYAGIDIALRMIAREHADVAERGVVAKEYWLRQVHEMFEHVIALRTISARGDMFFGPSEVEFSPVNVADRAYFRRHQADPTAGLVISEPLTGRITGRESIILSRRLKDRADGFAGVVVGSVPLSFFHSVFEAIGADTAAAELFLLRAADGRVDARWPQALVTAELEEARTTAWRGAVQEHPHEGYLWVETDAGRSLVSYHASDKFGFYVGVGVSEERVLADVRRFGIGMLGGLVLLLLGSVAYALRWSRINRSELQGARVAAEKDRQLREAYRVTHLGTYSLNLDTGEWTASEVLVDMLGLPADYPRTSEGWQRLVHPDDLARANESLAKVGDQVTEEVIRLVRPTSGETLWVQARSRTERDALTGARRLIGTVYDITEAKQAEAQLSDSRRLLEQFLEHLPAQAYVRDAQRRVLLGNSAYREAVRAHREDFLGRTTEELFPGINIDRIDASDRRVLETGVSEVIVQDYGGRVFEAVKFPIEQVEGRLVGGISLDVTERHRTEAELERQLAAVTELNGRLADVQHQLLQSEKMATIGQLAAGVAHEINNPIAFVNSNLKTLQQYGQDLLEVIAFAQSCIEEQGQAECVEELRSLAQEKELDYLRGDLPELVAESLEGIERVRGIVVSLRNFSRIDDQTRGPADLHAGLDSTLRIVWNEIKHKAELERCYGDLPQVTCVAAQINQVFLNLLVNAAQAIEGHGKVTISTGVEPAADGAPQRVWVEVRDTGKGIPQAQIKRIFDPFFTTKPVGQGTGLGLSLVWSIVEAHGGQVSVESELGVGTAFRVTLPVEPPQAA